MTRAHVLTALLASVALLAGCSSGASDAPAGAQAAARPGGGGHDDGAKHADHADHGEHTGHTEHTGHGAALATTAPLPGESVYQLGSTWKDQDGKPFTLASLRGKPAVVLMFYGTCKSVCPTLVNDVVRTDEALPEEVRAGMQYLLVTFDPATDTPAQLAALANARGLDLKRFRLLHGSDEAVRELATVLGVQYRSTGDGHFAHSSVLNLLDANGVFRAKTEGVAQPVEPLVREIVALLPEGAPAR